ncbi:hypothetical protein B0T14DRAFT_531823 [Immersiella caudata]|uniref:Uncharacterized protein n=1 Tax=Immersiella caudata TaxID=314043 RepID=A0AA39TM24_9PEZI|nr:hypothetical protein B0T14DRAFT_531823 [Immersiella caudata]
MLASIPVVLTAYKAAKASVKMEELRVSVNLLTTAAVTFLIVRLWSISELSLLFAPRHQTTNALAWFYIADPFLDRVGMFLVLLSIYYIGIRSIEKGGLWSSSQSRSTPY